MTSLTSFYFNRLSSFVRLFKAHLNVKPEIKCTGDVLKDDESKRISSSLEYDSVPITSEPQATSSSLCIRHDNKISKDCVSQSIDTHGIIFSLDLHNHNCFFFAHDIQKHVMVNLVQPIVSQVTNLIRNSVNLFFEQKLILNSLVLQIENKKSNNYIQPFEQFTINIEIGPIYQRGVMNYDEVETSGVLPSIAFQFQRTFEKNYQLLQVLFHMKTVFNSMETSAHFIQCSHWREKVKSFDEEEKIVISYFIYIYDAEVNNPLGSHCDPVSFVYYSFPVIEDCEIYLAAVFKGKDYKEFVNEKCLFGLVRELNKLEQNGIEIQTSEGKKTVFFVLGLVLGNNLGLNTVLGFVSSFLAIFL